MNVSMRLRWAFNQINTIFKELEIEKGTLALGEASKDSVPTALALVAFPWSVTVEIDDNVICKLNILTVSELDVL